MVLAGVGPKNMQKPLPLGQNPTSPTSQSTWEFSSSIETGISPYNSSPQRARFTSNGKASHIALQVSGFLSVSNFAFTCPIFSFSIKRWFKLNSLRKF